MTHTNREAWLHAYADAARDHFEAAGHPLPATLRIGVGWTSGGARAANKVIGECYHPAAASDGVRSIIISTGAGLPDAEAVAAVLTHELAHAALGDYPHSTLTAGETGKKKQSTRMLKAECACGYVVRLSAKWAAAGLPLCGACETRMTCEGVESEGEEEDAYAEAA